MKKKKKIQNNSSKHVVKKKKEDMFYNFSILFSFLQVVFGALRIKYINLEYIKRKEAFNLKKSHWNNNILIFALSIKIKMFHSMHTHTHTRKFIQPPNAPLQLILFYFC